MTARDDLEARKAAQEARKREAEYKRGLAEQEAQAAKAVLENPLLVKAFRELAAAYMLVWKGTAPGDVAQREDAWLAIRALEQLEGHLKAKILGGKVVNFNLRGTLAANAKEA
jgi:hypothetical protein